MARRQNKQEESNTEATAEATATQTEEKAPAPEVDLTAFKQAVAEAIEASDVSTGDVPEANISAVTQQYRALDGIKAKNAAKAHVNEGMKDRMNSSDLPGARAHLNLGELALVAAAGSSKSERPPADPTENFVQRIATLRLAYSQAVGTVPEGVKDDWNDRVETLVSEQAGQVASYTEWLQDPSDSRPDEPEVTAVVRNAAKLALGKSAKAGTTRQGGTFTGERRDIGAHIASAFADKADGEFLSIAEIRNTRSEEYGDNPPSAGAISARLFPKSGNSTMVKVGIHPTTQDSKKGAVKGTPSE